MQYISQYSIGSLLLVANGASALFEKFDCREASIESVHDALFTGQTTCRGVVSAFIARIEAFNPTINAIITLNPKALTLADQMDMQLLSGNATGSLFCIPVLLKDNFDTADMKTTGGCLDLARSQPQLDAPTTAALKNAGAIILGKTNLHELALEGLSVSSLGGQTVNPYDHTRTPGGSSGGTGAAIATSFAVFGTGVYRTDTVNSLRSPASANSLFSVRPTRGLITRAGIIPISYTQDAVGPIARNVKDLAIALTVLASRGYDPLDNITALVPPSSKNIDYSSYVTGGTLNGLRLGVIEGFFNRTAGPETTPVNDIMDSMISKLEAAGATIIPITSKLYNATAIIAALDVQTSEYRQSLESYLSRPSLGGTHPQTLQELYHRNQFLVIPSQYPYIHAALASSPSNASYATTQLGIQNLTLTLRTTFASHTLDALFYPQQKNLVVKIGSPSQSGRNGILAALTGSPVVTVPAGFSDPSPDAPLGVPVGMEILGLPWSEGRLLSIAALVQGLGEVRRAPWFANASVEVGTYDEVPIVRPNRGNIPDVYPVGVL